MNDEIENGQNGYVAPIEPDGFVAKRDIRAGEFAYVGDNVEQFVNLFNVIDVMGVVIEEPKLLPPADEERGES